MCGQNTEKNNCIKSIFMSENNVVDEHEKNIVSSSAKIFVGNVPFQCTKDEFIKCFSSMDGYLSADIIRRPKSKLSRGFGFVEFDTVDNATKLLNNNVIQLKDRTLRFTFYINQAGDNKEIKKSYKKNVSFDKTTSDNMQSLSHINIEQEIQNIYNNINTSSNYTSDTDSVQFRVFITNLPKDTTLDELKNILSNFGTVTSCYINTKRVINGTISGHATFKDNESYKTALDTKVIPNSNIELHPYKKRVKRFRRLNDARTAYREGFRAGHLVGYQLGLTEKTKNE